MAGTRAMMMEQAINELKNYYGVKSKEDFYLLAITGDEATKAPDSEIPDTGPASKELFSGLQNLLDGGMLMKDMLASFKEISDQEELVTQLRKSFLVVGGIKNDTSADSLKDADPAGLIHNSISLVGMLPTTGKRLNKEENPTKASPSITLVQVRPAALNICTRDTGAVDLFMNSIPTLEWSRAVPYFNMMVVNPGKVLTLASDVGVKPSPGSLQMFLMGNDSSIPETATGDYSMSQAGYEFLKQNYPGTDNVVEDSSLTMDMSSFTSPQTLVPADRSYSSYDSIGEIVGDSDPGKNPILDKMRPFMTVESFTVGVKGTRGMMSTKSGKLEFTLHDRSRLSEIGDLIRPGTFGKNEILIEYGWSHPDGLASSADNAYSAYGRFLDTMKVKEKYGVANTSYNFTDDGQVKVTLNLVTKGVQAFNLNDIALDPEIQASWAVLEEVIQTVRILLKKLLPGKAMEDVTGVSQISKLNLTNAHEVLTGDSLKEIKTFQKSLTGKESTPQAASDLSNAITQASKNLREHQTNLASQIGMKIDELSAGNDPFLMPRFRVLPGQVEDLKERMSNKWLGGGWDVTGAMTPNPKLRAKLRTKTREYISHPINVEMKSVPTADAAMAMVELEDLETSMAELPGRAHIAALELVREMQQLRKGLKTGVTDGELAEFAWDKLNPTLSKYQREGTKFVMAWENTGVTKEHSDWDDVGFGGEIHTAIVDRSGHPARALKEMKQQHGGIGATLQLLENTGKMSSNQKDLINTYQLFAVAGAATSTGKAVGDMDTQELLAEAEELRDQLAKMASFRAQLDFQVPAGKSDRYMKIDVATGNPFMFQAYGATAETSVVAVDRYIANITSQAFSATMGTAPAGKGITVDGRTITYSEDGEAVVSVSGNVFSGIGATADAGYGSFNKITTAISEAAGLHSTDNLGQMGDAAKLKTRSTSRVMANVAEKMPLWGKWQYASLGKIFGTFVAAPIAATGKYDEVQLYFYCFNNKASWMWTQNISSMPVKIKDFKDRLADWRKKRGNVSINSFFAFMSKAFVSSMDNPAYGFQDYYEWDKEKLTVVIEEKVNIADMSQGKRLTLASAYAGSDGSTSQELVFKRPSLSIYVEVVPIRTRGGGDGIPSGEFSTICRVHVFDRVATKYAGANQILKLANTSNVGVIKSGMLPLVTMLDNDLGGANELDAADHKMMYNKYMQLATDMKLIKVNAIEIPLPPDSPEVGEGKTKVPSQDVYSINGGPEAIKYFVKSTMPCINIGSATSAVISAGAASKHNSKMATIHMMRWDKAGKENNMMPGSSETGLPMRMSPMTVTMETFGCPVLTFGQQFFIDFGTNTTLDDIYAVSGIDHKIAPGDFKTSITFVKMESYGQYESLLDVLNKAAISINLTNGEEPAEDTSTD